MYRMLIVDDEPEIVESLYELFMGADFHQLDILKTYSSREAVSIVNSTKIDILLTDIRMPGINGLQLAEAAKHNWPKCRVIFLSGYNEFEYAYSAIKGDCEDYILKTENNREIIRSVENTIEKLEKSFRDSELTDKVKSRMKLAIPLLRRDFMLNVINGVIKPLDIIQEKLDELEISLDKDSGSLILFARTDNIQNSETEKASGQEALMAVKLILEDALCRYQRKIVIEYDTGSLICLIQEEGDADKAMEGGKMPKPAGIAIIKGAVETAQNICRESLNITISFVLSSESVSWDMINNKFLQLKRISDFSSGIGDEAFLTDKSFSNGMFDRISSCDNDVMEYKVTNIQMIGTLAKYLESGMEAEYFQLLSEISDCLRGVKSKNNNVALEIYYTLSTFLLSHINRWRIADAIAFKTGLYKLTRADQHSSWNDAVEYLRELSNVIFETQKSDQDKMVTASIKYIQQYIHTHINEQLSLTRLAEIVYFNPSYLSRLFKKITGLNISDYIMEAKVVKAKALLAQTELKIQELAEKLGFESATYFGRKFRKATNMTPQEYRESIYKR